MGKKVIYVILGLIVAIVVIVECFSNTYVKTHTSQIEQKIHKKLDQVFTE
jgi:hypothetical protein